jgi:hypothetical protein
MVLFAACVCAPPDPLGGKIHVVGGSGGELSSGQAAGSPPPQLSLPQALPTSTVERQITITQANSVFSIGMPSGYKEERQVNAQKPIDFWFEYLNSDMELTVNGQTVEIPARWSSKIGYTRNVTGFSYVMKNQSGQSQAYNLRMVPSQPGDTVQAVTREKWTAP